MTTLNVYLTFNGNCEEAFHFYKSVLGGDFAHVARYGEMPPSDNCPAVPEEDKNKIMHVSLSISKETVLMGCDSSEAFGTATVQGNNFSLSINTDSTEEADRIFNALSEGGKVTMPIDNTFWGSYFGMCVDKYNIQWMIGCEITEHQ